MTKFDLYVKICIMKAKIFTKTKILIIAFLSVLFSLCAIGYARSFSFVKADEITVNNFLPKSDLEHLYILNPTDALSFDDISAVMTTNSLLVYCNDKSVSINGTTFTEIEKFNDSILISSESRLHKIHLDTLFSSTSFELNTATKLSDEAISYFNVNDNYLVTSYATYLRVFTIDETGVQKIYDKEVLDTQSSDVAINKNNQIFYVASNGICMVNAQDIGQENPSVISEAKPKKMIANNEYLYYLDNAGKVHSLKINGENTTPELNLTDIDSAFELGKLENPNNISFKNENLLVTDGNTVQEFYIDNEEQTLIFTGFAIAKGKTAYNRISASATEIEKTNKNVAVLDDYKLTVYTNNNVSDRYARENYKNYLIKNLVEQGNNLSSFALGEHNALMLYNMSTSSSFVKLLDFKKETNYLLNPNQLPDGDDIVIRDVCYQSGYYYLLYDNGSAPQHVYKAKADGQLDFIKIDSNISTTEFTSFNVDTYGNVYLANKTTVAKLEKADNYTELKTVSTTFNNVIKLQSDLLGRVYVLDDAKVNCVDNNIEYSTADIKSFALDFVDDSVYFLASGSEMVYSTKSFENVSIEDLRVSENFNLTNPQGVISANENLEFYTVKDGENAYLVESSQGFIANDKFVYKGLSSCSSEYMQICAIECLGEQRFFALANQDSFVLVDKNLVDPVNKQKNTDVSETAFIATNVNAYYLPIISANDTFALNDSSQKITLTKTTVIKPQFVIEFLGCDYYYAEFIDNGISKFGYIPCDFTTLVLTEDFAWEEFKVERVKKTDVYSDSNMQEKIFSLKENTLVKIIEKGDKVCKIAYKDGESYKIGYIYTDKIIDQPSNAIRNVIIILAVFTCIFSTSLYFILRKKKS